MYSLSPISPSFSFFFFNDTATTEIYTLSLHDALPISRDSIVTRFRNGESLPGFSLPKNKNWDPRAEAMMRALEASRSEEHTSELQSHSDIVCRLLLEKKKKPQQFSLYVHHQQRAVCRP